MTVKEKILYRRPYGKSTYGLPFCRTHQNVSGRPSFDSLVECDYSGCQRDCNVCRVLLALTLLPRMGLLLSRTFVHFLFSDFNFLFLD